MKNRFPKGWDADRVKELLAHYEAQVEDEAIAEDEAAFEKQEGTYVKLPSELLPRVRALIAKHKREARAK